MKNDYDSFDEWLNDAKKEDEKTNPENILMPGGMTSQMFENILCNEILGKGWYVPYSCNCEQARAEIAMAIISKFRENSSFVKDVYKKLFGR